MSRRVAALLGSAALVVACAGGPSPDRATAAAPAAGRVVKDVEIGSRIVAVDGTLHLEGEVSGSDGPVAVQRATRCRPLAFGSFRCDWEHFDEVELAGDRTFRVPVEAPEEEGRAEGFYWRATVGREASAIWRTYRAEG